MGDRGGCQVGMTNLGAPYTNDQFIVLTAIGLDLLDFNFLGSQGVFH